MLKLSTLFSDTLFMSFWVRLRALPLNDDETIVRSKVFLLLNISVCSDFCANLYARDTNSS